MVLLDPVANCEEAFRAWSQIREEWMNDSLVILLRAAFTGGFNAGYVAGRQAKTDELNAAWDKAHESRGDTHE